MRFSVFIGLTFIVFFQVQWHAGLAWTLPGLFIDLALPKEKYIIALYEKSKQSADFKELFWVPAFQRFWICYFCMD